MMTPSKIVLLSLLSIPLIAIHANALKCYRCNSNDNPECFNVPLYYSGGKNATTVPPGRLADNSTTMMNSTAAKTPVATTKSPKQELLQECDLDSEGRQPFCRKISVTVLNNKHHRIIRECGYERSTTDCYKADNEDHLETVCQCWTDGCNGAAGLRHYWGFGALTVALVVAVVVI